MEAFNAILPVLTKTMSAVTPLMGMINQFSLASKEKAAMDRSMYYAKHPEAINALVAKFEKPLDTGLVKGTENIVNASMAEQGLSQAPGIQSQVLAQALAPYKQNSQQMAIAEAMKAIGLPMEALSAIQSAMRPDQLALMLKQILPQSNPSSSGSGIPNVDPSGNPWSMPGITLDAPQTPPFAGEGQANG